MGSRAKQSRQIRPASEHEKDVSIETQTRLSNFKRRPAAVSQSEMLARTGQDGSNPGSRAPSRGLESRTRALLRRKEATRLYRFSKDGPCGVQSDGRGCTSDRGRIGVAVQPPCAGRAVDPSRPDPHGCQLERHLARACRHAKTE